jgi:hypothetical protein
MRVCEREGRQQTHKTRTHACMSAADTTKAERHVARRTSAREGLKAHDYPCDPVGTDDPGQMRDLVGTTDMRRAAYLEQAGIRHLGCKGPSPDEIVQAVQCSIGRKCTNQAWVAARVCWPNRLMCLLSVLLLCPALAQQVSLGTQTTPPSRHNISAHNMRVIQLTVVKK